MQIKTTKISGLSKTSFIQHMHALNPESSFLIFKVQRSPTSSHYHHFHLPYHLQNKYLPNQQQDYSKSQETWCVFNSFTQPLKNKHPLEIMKNLFFLSLASKNPRSVTSSYHYIYCWRSQNNIIQSDTSWQFMNLQIETCSAQNSIHITWTQCKSTGHSYPDIYADTATRVISQYSY